MKKLRLGIIGVGHRGYITKLWHNPDGRSVITAVADIDNNALEKFKKDVTEDAYFTNDYKELLVRDDVDAVVVLTEDYKHKMHAIDTLNAGKDLYLEKPMAISIEDCDEIIKIWKKSGRKLMIGFNMRYMPMYQTMKKYIDDGYIGEVKAIWIRHFVGRGGVYYYQDWHRNSKYTNSLLLQKASHDIDMIHMFSNSYVKKVSAFGSLDFYNKEEHFKSDGLENQIDDEIDVEDNNILIMELENGIKASYLQNHFTPDYQRNYVIIGTKGRIENDEVNEKIIIKTRNTGTLHDMSDLEINMKATEGVHAGGDPRITEAFVDYILEGVEPNATPIDGRMSVAVGVKATESLRNGGELKIIPVYNLNNY
ncbi:Gfo/Idh/MocA family oxidoreductase [Jeotgalibaca sp. MA1X17-3]|uniref:Gfo/Idh/MocA family protein n=1 Tax=Jeotgalibaca sp. MA1X17-3 TaxID=2908211 RepID=UPI001F25F0D2|nr:Gfo/Idh/MocA family oxidoreductase [Jeotgalibaca sp. MA1X17-3]UJF15860.1 Gfo/Idh/MocA family oxidoreductase [Jeotgalibaca sp. MA1X17-3]